MMILSFFISSLLAERLSKPINSAATKSINPECQDEHAAVACEDDCFFEQCSAIHKSEPCTTSCSGDSSKKCGGPNTSAYFYTVSIGRGIGMIAILIMIGTRYACHIDDKGD